MKNIRDIFAKPIDRTIEEVIKVEQADEKAVLTELEEYVPTDFLQEQYARIFEEIASGPSNPREGIGIWISGFFGSGKSLFAKILGYTMAARKVGSKTASDIFKIKVNNPKIADLVDLINARIPFHAVIFDVSMDRGVRLANERLTEIIYKALLRELGYSEDFDLAELEITLEGDGKLDAFLTRFEEVHGQPWEKRRLLGLALNEAGEVLHSLYPGTYSTPDSYVNSVGSGRADIDPNKLARRAYELTDRRKPGHALIFIIDEVGQYVSRSVDKMLDLQAIVQALGVESKNRVEHKKAVSPCWLAVTSQEKLDEVVHALDSKKIELARLQDRFRLTVDLKQSDIAEITARRVLEKKPDAEKALGDLYVENEGRIKELGRLERTSRDISVTRESFVRLYPYLPYEIDLCVDIVAGLRLRRGAHRHVGGSNRTIIKQAQELMINPRTRLADAPIGDLVTLDKVYELLYLGNLLPSEVSREIDKVAKDLPDNPMAHKVAKAIALLEPVKNLPRTPHNLAVVLYPSVTSGPILGEVEQAIEALEKAQVIRNSEEGYKLLTVEEKHWETKRNGLDPREADRNRIKREVLRQIFSDPQLRKYQYQKLRTFRNTLNVEGETVEPAGEIPLNLLLADSVQIKPDRLAEARDESNARPNDVFWIVTLTDEIHDLVVELFRSREMVSEYERLASQQRLSGEESSCLSDEKNRKDSYLKKLRAKMLEAVQSGTGFFQGVQHDATALGSGFVDVFHKLFDIVVPVLYPKLEIGVLPLKGDEAEKLIVASNLNGLPQVFYHDKPEQSLVVKQSGKYLPNLGADLCRELFDYIKKEHSYGNKVTGKILESYFSGIGYGWEREALRLGLAILFRGGAVEVTHQGRKYRNYSDPACREPFMNNPKFRAASFAPRETLDLKILARAAQAYEEITGKDVNIEEGDIANAFQEVAAADRDKLLPVAARLKALKVPGSEAVADHLQWVEGILDMAPDDCVKTLAGEGKSYLEGRKMAVRLENLASEANLQVLADARRILNEQWPVLKDRTTSDDLNEAAVELEQSFDSENVLDHLERIRQAADQLTNEYTRLYRATFEKRNKAYEAAVDHVKGLPEWVAVSQDTDVPEEERDALLRPLLSRIGKKLDLRKGDTVCRATHATVTEMESDLVAVEGLTRQVVRQLQKTVEPEEKVERFRISQHFTGKIESEQDLDSVIKALRDKLEKLLAKGCKVILE
ncbi:hypothetical protein SAMN02745216_02521 [Desulfatibacillum alkenivorans DSM 16219]|jgi:hypothetical protein|uniref:BREX system P-loop protein BrxC n=1 Tax=Desulfatibacillum alkenivorans DSM 16219 TaxID=1121393 RepID=A0A1M6N5K4_9BACT|nr:BREX system P-loop protein BrxC [Desulfatibacillum alkenivorans]SHJ90961.1 hypothetical protein SAMN02745216_02521 [Desulfatibacillum alkenivorans DSM 16219]